MLNQDVSIDFNANVAPLNAALSQGIAQVQQMAKSTDSAVGKLNGLNSAFLSLTQRLQSVAGSNKVAVATAAAYQQQLSTVSATAVAAGKQFKGLSDITMKFAKDFPVGMDKAIATTKTLTTAGVTTTKEVGKLGSEFIKLQAATGEWGSGMVTDMLNLTKSFGNSNSMVKGFSDSLVTVSAKFGASASSVLAFSKAIAPIASIAGVSEGAVFGMSTAFSRMGEDGFRSANAFNKVLLDLQKSVTTGSPEIKEYAKAMNMTTDSLAELFKNDPTEVIYRFTDAINKQGPAAAQTLDNLGIGSVNALKSIQAIAKQGDLRQVVGAATAAFNNGSTNVAASDALNGVNDKIQTLNEKVSQTAATAGKPFLGFLGGVLGLANGAASAIGKLVGVFAGFGPVLPVLSAIAGVLKTLALLSMGSLALSWLKDSSKMSMFRLGRSEAAQGIATTEGRLAAGMTGPPPSSLLYRLGAQTKEMSMINQAEKLYKQYQSIPTPVGVAKEVVRNPFGVAGAAIRGVANLESNWTRDSISKPLLRIDESQAYKNNMASLKAGGGILPMEQQRAIVGENARGQLNAYNANVHAPMPLGNLPADMTNMQKRIAAMTGFVSDAGTAGFAKNLKALGYAAQDAAVNLKDTAKKIGAVGQFVNTRGAGGASGPMGILRTAEGNQTMLGQMLPMFAVMAGMAIFSKMQQQRNEFNKSLNGTGMADANSVYNAYAAKTNTLGYQTVTASSTTDVNAKATSYANEQRDWQHAIHFDGNDRAANDAIANAQSSSYAAGQDFGPQTSAKDVAAQITALYHASGNNPAQLSRMMQDVIHTRDSLFQKDVENEITTYLKKPDAVKEFAGLFRAAANAMPRTGSSDRFNNAVQLIRGEIQTTEDTAGSVYKNPLLINTKTTLDLIAGARRVADQKDVNTGGVLGFGGKTANEKVGIILTKLLNETLAKTGTTVVNVGDVEGLMSKGYGSLPETWDELIKNGFFNKKNLNATGKYLTEHNWKDLARTRLSLKSSETTPAEAESLRISASKAGGEDLSSTSSLFAAEDYASSKKKTVQQIAASPVLYNSASSDTKKAIDAYVKQNDLAAQAAYGASLSNQYLAKAGGDATLALQRLSEQLGNKDLAASSSEFAGLTTAFSQTMQTRSLQQSGTGGIQNIISDVGVGVHAIKSAAPTEQGAKDARQAEVDITASGLARANSLAKQIANLNHQVAEQNEDFQVSLSHASRDYQRQSAYQEADYLENRQRQYKAFYLNVKRQTQDFAKSFSNPFERIAAARTTDAYSTVGNLKQQNISLGQQMANIKKLKKMGLSDDAIRTLDLMNPNNAQEVARLLQDMSQNKSLVADTNKEVQTRMNLSKEYQKSPFNTQAERDRENLKQQMDYSEKDYKKAVARAKTIHETQIADMRQQLATQQSRAYNDILNFGDNVQVAGDSASGRLQAALNGMPTVAGKAATDTMNSLIQGINDELGNIPDINIRVAGQYTAPNHGGTITVRSPEEGDTGVYKGATYTYHQGHWSTKIKGGRGGAAHFSVAPSEVNPKTNPDGTVKYKAEGGFITGPGTGKSDSIPAMLSNGEYVVKADAVKNYGVQFLDALNNNKFASGGYVSSGEAITSRMASYTSHVSNVTSQQYDHSTQINGPITVQSNDPEEFLRKVNAKQKLQRLMQPVGN